MARRIVCSVIVLFVAGTFSLMAAPVYANEDRQWTVREAFEAQDIPYYQQSSNICSSYSGPITEAINAGQSGNSQVDDAEGHKIYNFFVGKGAPRYIAAAIVGNLYQESRYNHLLRQNKGTEPNPLKAGARHHPWNPQKSAGGGDAWGITQWDPGVSVLYWQKLAGIQGDITNKQVQLELVWWQLNNIAPTSKKNVLGDMKLAEKSVAVQLVSDQEAVQVALAEKAAAIMSARFLTPGIPRLEKRMEKAREAVKWPVDPDLVSSFPPATSCTTGSGVSSSVGDGGLTEEQAKTFVMNYGENRNNDTKNTLNHLWYSCNGMGSNCVSFSVFFLKKFTSLSIGATGNGDNVVNYLRGIGVPTGNEPRVGAIFSWSGGKYGHTGVVLGIQGDTVIVGHASCGSPGRGRGNGTMDSGSAFIRVGNKNDRRVWLGRVPTQFAYPQVDMSAVGSYVGTPTTPVPGGGSVAL